MTCANAGKKRCCGGRVTLCCWCGLDLCLAHVARHRCRQMTLRSVPRGQGHVGACGEVPEGFVEVGLGRELVWEREAQ